MFYLQILDRDVCDEFVMLVDDRQAAHSLLVQHGECSKRGLIIANRIQLALGADVMQIHFVHGQNAEILLPHKLVLAEVVDDAGLADQICELAVLLDYGNAMYFLFDHQLHAVVKARADWKRNVGIALGEI